MNRAKKWLAILLCAAMLFACVLPSGAEETIAPEPAATQEAAPTLEPTPEPTAEPTLEPTATPGPTLEPTVAPTSEPTAEPTTPPAAEPTPEITPVPEGASFETAILLKPGEEIQGELTEAFPVVYYQLTVEQKGDYEFLSDGKLPIKAALMETKTKTVSVFEPNLEEIEGQEPEHFACDAPLENDKTYYLVVESNEKNYTGKFSLVFDMKAEPSAEATVEPTAEPTPFPSPSSFLLEAAPLVTETVSPKVEKAPSEARAKPQGILVGHPSDGRSKKIAVPPTDKAYPYPESAHPYGNNLDDAQGGHFTNAIEVYVTFSDLTHVEPYSAVDGAYDYIEIYDYSGNLLEFDVGGGEIYDFFCGDELAGATLHIYSSGFIVRLVSDASNPDGIYGLATTSDHYYFYYGYEVTNVEPVYLDTPAPTGGQTAVGTVDLNWPAIPKADMYAVFRYESGGYNILQNTANTTAQDTTALPGETYSYAVMAAKAVDGEYRYSAMSDDITVQMLGTPQKPGVTIDSSTAITISWDAVQSAQGYLLYQADSEAGTYSQVADLSATSTQLTGLTPGGVYYYKIAAYTDASGTRITSVLSDLSGVILLVAPAFTECMQTDVNTVSLTWTSVPGAEGYRVARREADSEEAYDIVLATANTYAQDTTALSGKTYDYFVFAIKSVNSQEMYGLFSDGAIVSMLGTPQAPIAAVLSNTCITVSWGAVQASQGYLLYRAVDGEGTYTPIGGDLIGTSYQDTDVTPGTLYSYKVAAYTDASGSRIVSATSGAGSVMLLTTPIFTAGDQYSVNGARLAWGSIQGAEGYVLYRSTSQNGSYANISTLTGLTMDSTNLTPGQAYYYKVRAYKTVGSIQYFSAYSSALKVQILGKLVFSDAAAVNATKAFFKWPAVTGAAGYTLYVSSSATGTFKAVKSLTATSLEVTGLIKNTLYFYKAAAYKLVGGVKVYGTTSDAAAVLMMDPPIFKTAALSGATSAKFTWSRFTGATGYSLWRATASAGPYQEVGTTTGTSIENKGLKAGQMYYYKLRNYKTIGGVRRYGAFTAAKSVQVLAKAVIVKAEVRSTSKVYVQWNKVTGASGYSVYRATSASGSYTAVKTLTGTSAEITGQSAGKVYYYKVAAYMLVSGRKIYGTASDITSLAILAAPAIKTLDQSGAANVSITWGSVSSASGYTVYRSTSSTGTYTTVKSQSGTSFSDSGLTAGATYYYKVRAYKTVSGKASYGPYSAVKSIKLLAKPTVTATASGTTGLVKWVAVSGASGYTVYRSLSSGGTYTAVATLTGLSYSNTGLAANTTYYFKVAAYKTVSGKNVYGALSNPASAKTGNPSPTKYRALLVGQSSYPAPYELHGENDATSMSSMLSRLNMSGQTYQITKRNSQTKSQILSAISSAFAGATANDVSLFYYSGHGVVSADSYAGALVGVDDGLIKASELRSALDQIPGQIIVILDSCGSGSVIYQKSAKGATLTNDSRGDAEQFNQAFISAFGGGTIAKTGELRTSKYQVLTACAYGDVSVEVTTNSGISFGYFTMALCRAGGWDILTAATLGMLGDSNNDSIVTLQEAYSYIRYYLSEADQVVQAYPSNSTFTLFKK